MGNSSIDFRILTTETRSGVNKLIVMSLMTVSSINYSYYSKEC